MDILPNKVCPKHNYQANQMCTRMQCFYEANILICKECINAHLNHTGDLIEVGLLNEKVHELMKKRMQFQKHYEQCCDTMITQLKKFKVLKEEIVTALNYRERNLNELCKKIKRNIPYEKDKQLFKNNLGYVYLGMKGINPNLDLYRNFRQNVYESIKECRNSLHKLEINMKEIPTMLIKDHQICSILKKIRDDPVSEIQYYDPKFNQFEKKTMKISGNLQSYSKIVRISNQQFITFNKQSQFCRWFNINNNLPPRTLSIGVKADHIALLGKNAYITNQLGGILIYDLLNQLKIKQYASSNHKNASITNLLALAPNKVINFITCPNQMVAFNFDEQNMSLKIIKGVETKSKCIASHLLDDQFVGCFDHNIVKLFRTEFLQKQYQLQFQQLMKTVCKTSSNTYLVGGECNVLSMMDTRISGIVSKIKINQYCQNLRKIYPTSVVSVCGKALSIIQLRMEKQLFTTHCEQLIKDLEVINSSCFVFSTKNINVWKSIQ